MFFSFMTLDELVKILDITAHKWDLVLNKESVHIDHLFGTTKEGYILQNTEGMLDPVQKVLCNVFENDKKIDFLKVVHDGVHATLSVQAFGIGSKVLLDYYICASATEEENEIKKFIDMIIA